jgi:hypothetical protein
MPGVEMLANYPARLGHGSALASGGLRGSDARAIVAELRGRRASSVRISGGHHTADQWLDGRLAGTLETPRRVDVIDLERGWDAYFRETASSDIRRHTRKAQRSGVEIELDTTGRLVGVFYSIYRAWVAGRSSRYQEVVGRLARRAALRREPLAKFEAVAAALGSECRTFIAWHQGIAVAGCITLVHGRHAIGWRGYSIRNLATPVSANTLVQMRAIADAAECGCRYFDLGQSIDSPGLQAYKRSLGGVSKQVIDLEIERRIVSRSRRASRTALRLATQALARSGT